MNLNSYTAGDITLGQYYHGESLLYRLDPRVKLGGTFVFVLTLFLQREVEGYLYIALFLAAVVFLSRVPVLHIIKGISSAMGFILFIAFFQLFSPQGTVLFSLRFLQITDQGIVTACQLIFRLIALLVGTSIMTFTTTPKDLTDGFEKGFGFLKHINAPVHDIAMAMSIALRFIPILSEETVKIIRAQVSRGGDFEEGNFFRRIFNMIPLLIPLFVSAFQIAYDLSIAMEVRCYRGGSHRTKMYPLTYGTRDGMAYAVILLFLAGAITIRILSATRL
jgi:energy-coupling factor transport system permease protein